MSLTPEQVAALQAAANLEPQPRTNEEIVKLLTGLKCPQCGASLEYGGEVSVYRFVDLSDIGEGWQDGKDTSDGYGFFCSRNHRHHVSSVLPDDTQDLHDFLAGL